MIFDFLLNVLQLFHHRPTEEKVTLTPYVVPTSDYYVSTAFDVARSDTIRSIVAAYDLTLRCDGVFALHKFHDSCYRLASNDSCCANSVHYEGVCYPRVDSDYYAACSIQLRGPSANSISFINSYLSALCTHNHEKCYLTTSYCAKLLSHPYANPNVHSLMQCRVSGPYHSAILVEHLPIEVFLETSDVEFAKKFPEVNYPQPVSPTESIRTVVDQLGKFSKISYRMIMKHHYEGFRNQPTSLAEVHPLSPIVAALSSMKNTVEDKLSKAYHSIVQPVKADILDYLKTSAESVIELINEIITTLRTDILRAYRYACKEAVYAFDFAFDKLRDHLSTAYRFLRAETTLAAHHVAYIVSEKVDAVLTRVYKWFTRIENLPFKWLSFLRAWAKSFVPQIRSLAVIILDSILLFCVFRMFFRDSFLSFVIASVLVSLKHSAISSLL